MSPNKRKIVEDILLMLEAGCNFAKACSEICKKYQFSDRTFANYWKIAQNEFSGILEERRAKQMSIATSEYLLALDGAIMTKNEKLRILESIIVGKATFPKHAIKEGEIVTEYVEPEVVERLRAIDLHNKMLGHIAPTESKIAGAVAVAEVEVKSAGKNLDRLGAGKRAFLQAFKDSVEVHTIEESENE